MSSEVLDEAFAALEVATSLEERMNGGGGGGDITRSTDVGTGTSTATCTNISPAAVAAKYFEACGLLDRAAASISAKGASGSGGPLGGHDGDGSDDRQVLRLLSEKSSHYKTRARTLLQFQTSRPPAAIVTDPSTGRCRVDLDSVDARLSRAMDLDERGEAGEAVDEYAAAAAGYLAALRGDVGGDAIEAKIKKRLKGILDRIEQLKSSQGSGGVGRAHGAGVKEVPSRREKMKRDATSTASTRSIRSCTGGYTRRPRGDGESPSDYYASILSELRDEIAASLPPIDEVKRHKFLRACNVECEARAAKEAAVTSANSKDATEEDKGEASAECREAEAALSRAQHETLDAARPILADMGGTVLRSNRLDHLLVPCAVLSHATPGGLADFARLGPEEEALVDRLLDDHVLMTRMLLAGGARKGRYGRAMQIYEDILSASPNLDPKSDDVLHRLALGTCLEHAVPIEVFDTRVVIDPVLRYLHYECAYLAGEVDSEFANLSSWECRMAVNADAPDDTLSWGRDMLRNYRPDHVLNTDHKWRYAGVVRSEVRYKVPEWTGGGAPRTYQQMISGGGKCGPRAWFGRFASKSFGVPTWGCRQPGHAAMAHRTPGGGWTICLGGGRWDKSWWEDTRGEDFLLESEARRHGNGYVQVLRLRWIADALGEKRVNRSFGAIDDTNFFNALALMEMKELSAVPPVAGSTRNLGERGSVMTTAEVITIAAVDDEDKRVSIGSDGVITIPAVACTKPPKATANILFMKSFLGGMQLHCRLNSDEEIEYCVQCPHPAERYALTARVVTVHSQQEPLMLRLNDDSSSSSQSLIEIDIPYTVGRWAKTSPVEVKLLPGSNVLNFRRKGKSLGLTVKDFTLTPCR